MDYAKHYERLIARARSRLLAGYVEIHHVLPSCMGGSDDSTNKVQLTPEEHFVAHQLLCKMYPEVRGLAAALVVMSRNPRGRQSNKVYGWIRRKAALLISKIHKGRVKSAKERANIAEAGRRRAPRTFKGDGLERIRAANIKTAAARKASGNYLVSAQKTKETRIRNGSYQFSAEHRANIGKAALGRSPSEETRAKLSAALKGRAKSPETVAKMRAASAARRKPIPPQPTPEQLALRRAERSARSSAWQKGRTLPQEHRAHIGEGQLRSYANGRRGAHCKLSDDDVREIRLLLQQPGIKQKEIAARYGISQGALSELKSGKSYRHVI